MSVQDEMKKLQKDEDSMAPKLDELHRVERESEALTMSEEEKQETINEKIRMETNQVIE